MEENTAAVNDIGTVKIASDVVGTIAVMAAQEVEGIFSMSGGFTDDIAEKFGMKSSNKGIKVQVGETEAAIDLYLIVDYGVKIPEVCSAAQERVKNAVETMTGLKVVEV
ncbi:MAG TPA: Asp23/Gls24 family envelope stress response protein, partial [Clostridiaceae bacterium]|nr:Asp23/Gls24 family envelope stress response protein [Clostridiaceae bacterium]HBX48711.1 Asp23/Gls24 family envelope stress response protein [Clostridiaceae bacterium]